MSSSDMIFTPRNKLDRLASKLSGIVSPKISRYSLDELQHICYLEVYFYGKETQDFLDSLKEMNFKYFDLEGEVTDIIEYTITAPPAQLPHANVTFRYRNT